jgi:hypothetical protein
LRAELVDTTTDLNVKMLEGENSLVEYVLDKNREWEEYAQSNFYKQWDEYYRIWRGIWSPADRTREVERSRIVTPATQQAVESSVCEIEEATFGQGKYFDLRDDNVEKTKIKMQNEQKAQARQQAQQQPQGPQAQGPQAQGPQAQGSQPQGSQPQGPQAQGPQGPDMGTMSQEVSRVEEDMAYLQRQLDEDLRRYKVRAACSEVLINAAVWGTGIAEIVITEELEMKPASESIMDGQLTAYGVTSTPRVAIKMKPVLIKNFRIDPLATSIDNAHGCSIEEFVSAHEVKKLQNLGVYKKGEIGTAPSDEDLEPNPELDVNPIHEKVSRIKYFGLVPKSFLTKANKVEDTEGDALENLMPLDETEEETPDDDDDEMVEAIVVIANGSFLLKAEENPFMMQDRPVVAFQWDVVPGLFYGRGVVEKGYNSQKALDAEIRARIDALALTIHPMMAMDATKIPRGHKPQIVPGKMLLTNGNPTEVLMPFKFGDVSQITFGQAAELQKMVQQSTGAVDSSGVSGMVNGEATAAGISMSLGAIIKRQKRTLVNFQECFWIPFIEKTAWRYMQFAPELYPVKDYNFIATSTLGIMAREYQVSQLVQLLQTMSPDSPMYPKLTESIVESMNITNREELLDILQKASAPNPEAKQMQQAMHKLEMDTKQAIIEYTQAQTYESKSRGDKYTAEAKVVPQEVEIKKIDAVTKNLQPGAAEDKEFARRIQIAEVAIKEKELAIKGRTSNGI